MKCLSAAAILFAALIISGCGKNSASYTKEMPKGFEDCITAEMTIQGVSSRVFRCPGSETHTEISNPTSADTPKNDHGSYKVIEDDQQDKVRIKTPKDDKLTDAVSVDGIIYRVNNDLTEIMVDAKTERRLADSISINGIEYRRELAKEQ